MSIRPEKLTISLEKPEARPHINLIEGVVEDVVYLGSQTKYWVRAGEYRISVIRQHSRFLLDEKPITWQDHVWLSWHADDGFMLEKYSEADENLLRLPPEEVGDADAAAAASEAVAQGLPLPPEAAEDGGKEEGTDASSRTSPAAGREA